MVVEQNFGVLFLESEICIVPLRVASIFDSKIP
jgi:hypothetical protein